MRKCSSCGQTKPTSEFYAAGPARKTSYECKACHSARKARRYEERKALGVTATKSLCLGCQQVKPASAFRKNWHRGSGLDTRCHDCISHRNRRMHFELEPEDYQLMLDEQGGVCAICGQRETSKKKGGAVKALAVDHCHSSGMVRALLCENCNKGLGVFGDDPDRLLAAVAYLKRYADPRR